MRRVAITGLGVVSPLGNTVEELWGNIVAGKTSVGPITKFDASKYKTQFACEVKDFHPENYIDKKELKKYDVFTQFAIASSDDAIADSGLDFKSMSVEERADVGVIWASGNGGIKFLEEQCKEFYSGDGTPRFSPYLIPKMIVDIAAGVISIRHRLHGPNYCAVSACASSNTAIINAFDTIRLGKAKVIITGGSEASITEACFGGFSAAQALSKRNDNPETASRPFDKNRDGFVMAEGAAALVLEDMDYAIARGAKIYAEMVGGGMAADAYHLTGTAPDGIGARLGMQKAIEEAGISASEIDYINAHATSTPLGDSCELIGIGKVFNGTHTKENPLHISASKSMTGHLLGAAGGIESIISIMSTIHDIVPATINVEEMIDAVGEGLHVLIGKSISKPVNYVLNNTFGFGGHTATTIFKKYQLA